MFRSQDFFFFLGGGRRGAAVLPLFFVGGCNTVQCSGSNMVVVMMLQPWFASVHLLSFAMMAVKKGGCLTLEHQSNQTPNHQKRTQCSKFKWSLAGMSKAVFEDLSKKLKRGNDSLAMTPAVVRVSQISEGVLKPSNCWCILEAPYI